ncbi:MAG: hypothetical protein HY254_06115, partial [Burkholderiales bacterium]|nr:hypothetical protein [Burkholderiales bacterium]
MAGADFYYLWVDDLSTGTSQVIGQTHVTGTSYTPTTPLTDNHSYRTWVQAGNVFGNGPWSSAVDFATGTAPVAPPTAAATLTSPAAFVPTLRPTFGWNAVSGASDYDLWVDDQSTGTSQVVRQTQVSGLSFSPATDLVDGHTYRAWVRAGNVFGYGPWSSYRDTTIDTVQPSITGLAVSPRPITNVRRPTFSGVFSASVSGIDTARTTFQLDSQDVTASATADSSGFSFMPTADLSEGAHVLQVTVYSGAGLTTTGSISVTTDYTPPSAPIITNLIVTADRITASGPTDPDVVSVHAAADTANVESAIISSFVVVFARTDSDTFTGTIQLEDAAGNLSPILQQSFAFGVNAPPVSISELNFFVPGGKQKIDVGSDTFTDSTSVTVRYTITGGTAPFTSTVNGTSASPIGSVGNIFEATLNNLPNGRQTVFVSVSDSADQSDNTAKALVVDVSSPAITMTDVVNTAPLSFLYLNDSSVTPVRDTTSDLYFPRATYDRRTFAPAGNANDGESNIQTVRVLLYQTNWLANDLAFPFPDYGPYISSLVSSLVNQTPIASAVVYDGSSGTPGSFLEFSATNLTSARPETPAGKIEVLILEATDTLGNKGYASISLKIDTSAPKLGGTVSGSPPNQTFTMSGGGPLLYVSADTDAIRLMKAGTRMLRAEHDGAWILPQSVPGSGSSGVSFAINTEDMAGNYADQTVNFNNTEADVAGTYTEFFGLTVTRTDFFEFFEPPDNWIPDSHTTGIYGGSVAASRSLAADGAQIDDPSQFYGSGTNLSEVTINNQNWLVKLPSWADQSPVSTPYSIIASFPNIGQYNLVSPATVIAGSPVPVTPQYNIQTNVSLYIGSIAKDLPGSSSAWTGGTSGEVDISPSEIQGLRAGKCSVRANIGSTNYVTGYNSISVPKPQDQGGLRFTSSIEEASVEESIISSGSGTSKDRAITVYEVTPDTLVAGQRTKLRIRAYVGDDAKPGDFVPVSFSPSTGQGAGTGALNIVPVDTNGNPDPNGTPGSSGNGRVVFEDSFNATVFQTVEVLVEPSVDDQATTDVNEGALGVFDVTVADKTLQRMVNVVKFEWQDHENKPVSIVHETPPDDESPYLQGTGQPGGIGGFGGPHSDTGFHNFQDPFRFADLVFNSAGSDGLKTITCSMISNVSETPTNGIDGTNAFVLKQLTADSTAYATDNGILGLMMLNNPQGSSGQRKTFDALVINPVFGFKGTRTFYETGIGTNTYMTRRLLLVATLDSLTSPTTMAATLSTDVPGSSGAYATGSTPIVLSKTGSGLTFQTINGSFVVRINRITSNNAAAPDDFTATVSSTLLDVSGQDIDAIESGNTTLEFRTDLLHNADTPAILIGNADAVIGGTYHIAFAVAESSAPPPWAGRITVSQGATSVVDANFKVDQSKPNDPFLMMDKTSGGTLFMFKDGAAAIIRGKTNQILAHDGDTVEARVSTDK